MRKIWLSFIITMSLAITSGAEASLSAQQRLEQTLQRVGAGEIAVEIMVWYPDNDLQTPKAKSGGLAQGWGQTVRKVAAEDKRLIIADYKSRTVEAAVNIYHRERAEAKGKGGGASLKISAVLPASNPAAKATGEALLLRLGGDHVVQEIQEGSLYSGASLAQGWGPPVFVGNDEINLQLVLKPDAQSGLTRLYITAPVIIGDL